MRYIFNTAKGPHAGAAQQLSTGYVSKSRLKVIHRCKPVSEQETCQVNSSGYWPSRHGKLSCSVQARVLPLTRLRPHKHTFLW